MRGFWHGVNVHQCLCKDIIVLDTKGGEVKADEIEGMICEDGQELQLVTLIDKGPMKGCRILVKLKMV